MGELLSSPSPRVAPPSVFSGSEPVGPDGGLNSHWFGSLLLSESGLKAPDSCAGTLTACPSVKATATIIASIVKRNERVNQAIRKIFSDIEGLYYKNGITEA
jgi:hypothetical protein